MTLSQYNPHCIFYCDPIKNSIMNDGNFIRIIYATQNITLNGIILQLQVNNDYQYITYNLLYSNINHTLFHLKLLLNLI